MTIAIVGNGISGVTAARELRKLNSEHEIVLISSETEHFFSRTALMYIYMGHMKYEHTKPYEDWFWTKNRIDLKFDHVEKVDFDAKELTFSSKNKLKYDKLILATGSTPNKFGWKGQDAKGVQGLYSYQDLESLEALSPEIEIAVIVGGGLIGIELAEMLKTRQKKVLLLVREDSFWNNVLPREESQMINEHIKEHHIDLLLNEELDEILTHNDKVVGIKTKSGQTIDCQFVGLTVGVSPNISFLKDTPLKLDRGILINPFFETNIKDVYAIGDCAQHESPPKGRRPLEQIWYTGKIMGKNLAENILAQKTAYDPGVFFNSAKFLDIEYQTYGMVPARQSEENASFFWQKEGKHILFRMDYEIATKKVLGINTFGIRMRHEVWDKWIGGEKTTDYVLENLAEANFDPEFFKRYENEIVSKYNTEFNTNIIPAKKSGNFLSRLFN